VDADRAAPVALGWLWFDNDPRTSLEDKLTLATGRFREKFGREARLCYLNRQSLPEASGAWGALRLLSAGNVGPGYFLFVLETPG